MPFSSKKQMRFLAANVDKIGGWSKFHQWVQATPDIKKLPEKVKKTDK